MTINIQIETSLHYATYLIWAQRRLLVRMVLIGYIVLVSACKKETDPAIPRTENQSTNDWILEKMQTFYYWNDKIPANPDKTLNPADFFKSLLNTYNSTSNPGGDRFSWINENGNELKASLHGETTTTGIEYGLFTRTTGSDDIISKVFYVLPNSPAQKAGIRRGDIIFKVNGQKLTTSNYASLLSTGTTFTYGFATVSGNTIVDSELTKTVTATVIQENPVFLDSIYTIANKKVGYLMYNQCVPGPNNTQSDAYDKQVDAVFDKFKREAVNELILDLRYNSGGYTSSAANLASLIGTGVNSGKLFFREEWNSSITPELQKEYGSGFFIQNFLDKAQSIGGNLTRLFVLTTVHTASASELIINGLRPYMTVITIGTTTLGKNVGSITITDDTGKISWGMQPIVFKSFNSAGQSDYATGFKPTIEVKEPLSMLPLGDVNEALLSAALSQIQGNKPGRLPGVDWENSLPLIGSSIQDKAGGPRMIKTMKY